MQTYILSIGLNVGRYEPSNQLGATLRATEAVFSDLRAVGMVRGEWEGVAERTLHIAVRSGPNYLFAMLPSLARILQQQAVAVTLPGGGHWDIVYADGHRETGGSHADFPIAVDLKGL